jgi:phage FluMu protein Com
VSLTLDYTCQCCGRLVTMTSHCDPNACVWWRCPECKALNDYKRQKHSGGHVTVVTGVTQHHDHAPFCTQRTAPV